jgi:hypothetical protein
MAITHFNVLSLFTCISFKAFFCVWTWTCNIPQQKWYKISRSEIENESHLFMYVLGELKILNFIFNQNFSISLHVKKKKKKT